MSHFHCGQFSWMNYLIISYDGNWEPRSVACLCDPQQITGYGLDLALVLSFCLEL